MKINRFAIILVIGIIGIFFTAGSLSAAVPIYGHISYEESNPKIVRVDQTEQDAVVNTPIAPGDVIVTNGRSKCELQFDNGTIMRLGNNSRLRVVTVLAKSLTSKWKLTTLELQKGSLYTLNKSYNQEQFQVITPNAAVKMKRHAISVISFTEKGETKVFSEKGRFVVMYGADENSLETRGVKPGQGYIITTDHKMLPHEQRDANFLSWNQYVNKNFKKLHYGISKVPKKIYRYSRGIVNWAEKWSTKYGEWVYDDLFGYVWKPGDERFAFSDRPFFNAHFEYVNNQLFVVPTEAWGWAPAHMGTWVWTNTGWTWVPGNTFNTCRAYAIFPNAAEYSSPYYANTLVYWIENYYGSVDLYFTYHRWGYKKWRNDYMDAYKKTPVKPSLKNAPANIRALLKKLDKAPLNRVKNRLAKLTPSMKQQLRKKEALVLNHNARTLKKSNGLYTADKHKRVGTPLKHMADNKMKTMSKKALLAKKRAAYYRDWNPDKKWAKRRGVHIVYSSKRNEVICPKLRLSSNTISRSQRTAIGSANVRTVRRTAKYSRNGSGAGNNAASKRRVASGTFARSNISGNRRAAASSRGSAAKSGKK